MAKRKEIETSSSDTAATPGDAADKTQPGTELPAVESPSISPATSVIAADPIVAEEPAAPAAPTETVSAPGNETPSGDAAHDVAIPRMAPSYAMIDDRFSAAFTMLLPSRS